MQQQQNNANRSQSTLAPRVGQRVLAKAKAPPLSWKVNAKLVTNQDVKRESIKVWNKFIGLLSFAGLDCFNCFVCYRTHLPLNKEYHVQEKQDTPQSSLFEEEKYSCFFRLRNNRLAAAKYSISIGTQGTWQMMPRSQHIPYSLISSQNISGQDPKLFSKYFKTLRILFTSTKSVLVCWMFLGFGFISVSTFNLLGP